MFGRYPSSAMASFTRALVRGATLEWSLITRETRLASAAPRSHGRSDHRADDSVTKAITRILRADLVIVDDIGLLPVGPDAAEGLYRLVDAAYERRSVAVSSNLHPSGFDELMPKTLATATVDRAPHHAHLCQTSGKACDCPKPSPGAGVVALAGGPR